jgi:putative transposase
MGEKKVKGRKRHIVTDVDGRLLHIKVHAANIHDTKGAVDILEHVSKKHTSIKGYSADAGYLGTTVNYVENILGLIIEISHKIKEGWAILAKRWVVERTFSWVNNWRRMSKDYEIHNHCAENFFRIAMIKIMLDKLV